MKVIELLKSKEWSGKVIDCVLRFALSFALAGAQVFGGYAPLAEHEDVDLVERMRQTGAVCVAADTAWVQTSGRTFGRTDGGYARYLREDLIPLARQVPASAAAVSDGTAPEAAASGGSESAPRREVRDRDGAARA